MEVAPADDHLIRGTVKGVAKDSSDLLILFWGGHGVRTRDDTTHLICADAENDDRLNVDLGNLLAYLRTDQCREHPRQLVLVDACQAPAGPDWYMPVNRFQLGKQALGRLRQDALIATSPGERAANDDRGRTGLFTDAVLGALTWPGPDDRFAQLFAHVETAATTATQHPSLLEYQADGQTTRTREWAQDTAPTVKPLTELGTFRVPTQALAGRAAAPGRARAAAPRRGVLPAPGTACDRAGGGGDARSTRPAWSPRSPSPRNASPLRRCCPESTCAAGRCSRPGAAARRPAPPTRSGPMRCGCRRRPGAPWSPGVTDVRSAAEYVRAVRRLVPGVTLLCLAETAELADRAARLAASWSCPSCSWSRRNRSNRTGAPSRSPSPRATRSARSSRTSPRTAHRCPTRAVRPSPCRTGWIRSPGRRRSPASWPTAAVGTPPRCSRRRRDRRPALYPALLAACPAAATPRLGWRPSPSPPAPTPSSTTGSPTPTAAPRPADGLRGPRSSTR